MKPLQESHFKQLRDVILNLNHQGSAVEHMSMLENNNISICSITETQEKSEQTESQKKFEPAELSVTFKEKERESEIYN
jgi:hypothetical protein